MRFEQSEVGHGDASREVDIGRCCEERSSCDRLWLFVVVIIPGACVDFFRSPLHC